MGDELFLRSRCSGGEGCHCSGMEHFYVPESTDRPIHTGSRGRRSSNHAGGGHRDPLHAAKGAVRPALSRAGGNSQDCATTLLASVFDQVGEAPADGRQVRSRRVRRSSRGQSSGPEPIGDTSGLPDLSYLAYSSDEEYEEFIKKPRTDYTYSRSLSYTAVSPQRVGPPNMSRLGVHSPGHGAGDSPVLGSRGVTTAGSSSRRTAAGRQQQWMSPALAGGGEQGVFENTSTRVYSYRREITSHVSSSDLLLNGALHGLSSGLDADSQDEEWLSEDGASKLGTGRCSTPYKTHSDWSVRRGANRAFSLLLRLWLLVVTAGRRLWGAARPLFLAPVPVTRPVSEEDTYRVAAGTLAAGPAAVGGAGAGAGAGAEAEAGAGRAGVAAGRPGEQRRGSRPPSRHRYDLRPRLTPQRDAVPSDRPAAAAAADGWDGPLAEVGHGSTPAVSTKAASAAADSGEPGPLVTFLAWLSAVLWFINPLRWVAAIGRAAISRTRAAAEVLDLPRGGATTAAALNPTNWARAAHRKPSDSSGAQRESRPGWVRSASALLWSPFGTAAAASSTSAGPARPVPVPPGSGTRAELWRRSGSILDGAGSRAARPNDGGSLGGDQWSEKVAEGGGAVETAALESQGRRGCLPLVGALLLLLLLTLLLLPIMGWLCRGDGGGDGGESPQSQLLLPAGWRPLLDSASLQLVGTLSSAAQGLAGGLSSLAGGLSSLTEGVAGGLSYLTGGLSSLTERVAGGLWYLAEGIVRGLISLAAILAYLIIYIVTAVQVMATRLVGAVGSLAPALWAPLISESSSEVPVVPGPSAAVSDSAQTAASAAHGALPADLPASAATPAAGHVEIPVGGSSDVPVSPADPQLVTVLSQLDKLKSRVDLLQSEYQSCRAASERSSSSAGVRAALGLSPDSPVPVTADRLAATELRLQRRLESELAAVRALLGRPPADGGGSGELAGLVGRLAALETSLPAAAERRDAAGRAADARLHSVTMEMERLRADMTSLQRSLAAARQGLKQAGVCCNRTGPDWSSLLGAQLGRLESQLEDRIEVYGATIRRDLTSEVSSVLTGAAAAGGGGGGGGGVSREEALNIAQSELALYDADKTGKFDFALESAGGSVISTKCTEAYTVRSARLTVLGVPLWYPANNPRSIIQPHMQPGECFAFHGEGRFVVSLSRPVRPTEFVIEHIARGLTPEGRVDSAPRHCSVLGVGPDGEPAGMLASFEYSSSGPPLQRFAAAAVGRPVEAVELRVASNWGHPEYTCLYRFRVHGVPESEPAEARGEGGR